MHNEQYNWEKRMAKALRLIALQDRDSHKNIAFFGNEAREVLADYLGIDVKELEPGSESALKHLEEFR